LLGLEPVRRPPVTMTVEEGAARELRRRVAVFAREELGEMERLLAEALRVLVVGQHLQQLVAEDGDAARLDADERDACADLLPEGGDRAFEVTACEPEEAVVVQRPSAADAASRNLHLEAGVLELLDGRHPDLGLEVV